MLTHHEQWNLEKIIGVKPMGFKEIALNNRWDLLENYLNFGELKS